mgnify:CR=1 FL=1
MHFEILVEDLSGKKLLDTIVPDIIGSDHSFRVIPYRGVGHLPKGLNSASEIQGRALLSNLPRLLGGYGNTYRSEANGKAAVIVVCDLDNKCLKAFREELLQMLSACRQKPVTRFCIAVEEMEAWLLGDQLAVKKAYPKARNDILGSYENDSICDTWEKLADAVFPGGSRRLKTQPWHEIGLQKNDWAAKISAFMKVDNNKSPSFAYFKKQLQTLATGENS